MMEKVWTGQEVNKVVAKDVHEGNRRSIGRTEPWDAGLPERGQLNGKKDCAGLITSSPSLSSKDGAAR